MLAPSTVKLLYHSRCKEKQTPEIIKLNEAAQEKALNNMLRLVKEEYSLLAVQAINADPAVLAYVREKL